jgi:hypothetical protein
MFMQIPKPPAIPPPMPSTPPMPTPAMSMQPPPVQPRQQQPPAQPPKPSGPTASVDLSPLSNEVIQSLNKRLNDIANDEARAGAAMDFFKILDAHPQLADDPVYKPYVDAFMQKILSDPSEMVRFPGELAMQMGKVPHPSPEVLSLLDNLAKKQGFFDFESGTATGILDGLRSGALQNISSQAPAEGTPPGGGNATAAIPGEQSAASTPRGNPAGETVPPEPEGMPGMQELMRNPQAMQQLQGVMSNQGEGHSAALGGIPPSAMSAPMPGRAMDAAPAMMTPGGRLNMLSRPQPTPPGVGAQPGQRLNTLQGGNAR